jgi:DNA repair and recombination protein RAD52
MFSDQQKAELAKPLLTKHVKHRSQSGRSLSYVEGWFVIAEANRVFGFDGWTRETVEIKCVSERERKIGQQGASGWGVTYIAKVRVNVGGIVREGCGTGHGIDRDCGQAHESALKEAETDAMKRALMTFGNIFGLALYDKTQENVSDEEASAPESSNRVLDYMAQIDEHMKVKELRLYGEKIAVDVSKLAKPDQEKVRAHFASRLKALKAAENLAA